MHFRKIILAESMVDSLWGENRYHRNSTFYIYSLNPTVKEGRKIFVYSNCKQPLFG